MSVLAQLARMSKTSLDGVIATDPDGKIMLFDREAEAIFGFAQVDVVGRQFEDVVVPPPLRGSKHASLRGLIEAGNRIETDGLHANGQEIKYVVRACEVTFYGHTYLVGFFRGRGGFDPDSPGLVHSDHAKLFAMLAHDIRTPMGGILGSLSLIDTTKLDGDSAELVLTARQSGILLADLLEESLDLGRSEAGEIKISLRPTSLRDVIQDVEDVWRRQLEEKGLDLRISIADGLPPALELDPVRLRQILNNLLSNSFKHTERGAVGIDAAYDTEKEVLNLAVWDSGTGFSREARATMAKPFSRPDQETSPGHGVGLSITISLLGHMGGTFEVLERPGGGALVYISVPAKLAVTARSRRSSGAVPDLRISFTGRNVLLVEDNKTNLFIAERMLKALRFQVTTAMDGLAGVAAARAASFDLILMDIDLPGLNGIDAIREIRASGGPSAQTQILALTAYVTRDYRSAITDAGANGIIPKPIDSVGQLGRAIGEVLQAYDRQADADPQSGPAESEIGKLFHPAALNSLKEAIGPAAMSELCRQLEADLTENIRVVEADTPPFDVEKARRATHILSSVAGTMGAHKLENHADLLNACCHAADLDKFDELRDAMIETGHATLEHFGTVKWVFTDEL